MLTGTSNCEVPILFFTLLKLSYSLTEVNYNHQLELTYEVDDGTLLTTYYAVLPVTAG